MATPCSFTYGHYAHILELFRTRGFRFSTFSATAGQPKVVWLRHDIDVAPEAALPLAALEARQGVSATYFLQLTSPYYNLLDGCGRRCVARLLNFGHRIGLHFRAEPYGPRARTPEGISALVAQEIATLERHLGIRPDAVSFHKPSRAVVATEFPAFVNVYAPRFFLEATYLSDSRMTWVGGCPCRHAPDGRTSRFQILVHPEWWSAADGDRAEKLDRRFAARAARLRHRLRAEILPGEEKR